MDDPCACSSGNADLSFEAVARIYLWAADHPITSESVQRQVDLAEFCKRHGTFRWLWSDEELVGFGEWLRLEMEHLPVLDRMQEDGGWLELTEDEIQNGPVLYWANGFCIKRGVAWKQGQAVAQLPGVTHVAGWQKGRVHISTVEEVLSCRSLRQWLSQT
jgi:hypothetical protein